LGLGIPAGFVSRIASDLTGDKRFQRFADAIDGGYAALFCGAYFQQPEAIEFINKRLKKSSIQSERRWILICVPIFRMI
jgi:hypothetical protein